MTEDKVALTEYRPHTAVIITIGFNSMTLKFYGLENG